MKFCTREKFAYFLFFAFNFLVSGSSINIFKLGNGRIGERERCIAGI